MSNSNKFREAFPLKTNLPLKNLRFKLKLK